jgi:hypothetical protein
LLPREYKHLICGKSTGNGNCLFNSASIILYGDENQCMQLRLAVIIELMKNAKRYLEIEAFETDITYSNDALNSANFLKKQNPNYPTISEYPKYFSYLSELKRMCHNFSWCSLLALYGLANVVKQPVHSIYPDINSKFIRDIYNIEITPFQPCEFKQPLYIFWTDISIQTKIQADLVINRNNFNPNHFVPCFLKIVKKVITIYKLYYHCLVFKIFIYYFRDQWRI